MDLVIMKVSLIGFYFSYCFQMKKVLIWFISVWTNSFPLSDRHFSGLGDTHKLSANFNRKIKWSKKMSNILPEVGKEFDQHTEDAIKTKLAESLCVIHINFQLILIEK